VKRASFEASAQHDEALPATRRSTSDQYGETSVHSAGSVRAAGAAGAHAERSSSLELIGRETECERLGRLLSAARDEQGASLLLTGEPGIGKSALCAWTVREARDMRILAARGVEAEADLPFAGLTELCAGQLERLDALPVSQAAALKGALALHTAPRGHRLAIGAALLSLLSLLAEQAAVFVVIDDVQWIDTASIEAIVFAARRLRGERIAALLAGRVGTPLDAAALDRLTLTGLSVNASRALLATAHGEVAPPVAQRLAATTGGNPLALLEVPRLLTASQLAGRGAIDEPLPVGPAVERALLGRVWSLPASSQKAVLLAAASGSERLQPVIDALNMSELSSSALDSAERAGVLTIVGERFSFRHPLLRSAVYHGAAASDRRAAHATLARVSHGDARTWHLAEATIGEDEAVARELERAGMDARRRGAPVAAAAALERAARLTPEPRRRVFRLTEAARDGYVAGRPDRALELLDEAVANTEDPAQRADIQHLRGRILVLRGSSDVAYRLLVYEAERVAAIDPTRAATMLAEACLDCIGSADIRKALATADSACHIAEHADPGARTFARSMLASVLVLSGRRDTALEILERLLPALRMADPLTEAGELVTYPAHSFAWLERYDVAADLLDRMIDFARRASAPATLPWPLTCRAELDLRLGRWAPAAARSDEARSLAEEFGQHPALAFALDCRARLDAMTGDESSCRRHSARALQLADEHQTEPFRAYIHATLGLLELGLGHPEAAVDRFEIVRGLAAGHGLAEPSVIQWQADHVEACLRAGRRSEAETALAAFRDAAEACGGRWARGTSARCRVMLVDRADRDAAFAEAIEQLSALPAPFELARTQLCRGERLRRDGHRTEAREALRKAIDGFNALGALPWLRRAQAELGATGETPRRRSDHAAHDQLTAHELRVAIAVASGATNREAAASLFLSRKTIEFHLAHVFRKLGVRTRTELALLAARRGWLDDPAPHEKACDPVPLLRQN